MNFYIENSPDDAASFGSIVTAGFAANSWLDADPTGKQFRFEIYQPHGKAGGYVVKVMDDMGFTIGHIAMNIRDMIESDPLRNELKALFARAEEISRNEIARLERV
jgi:hypothetical protein